MNQEVILIIDDDAIDRHVLRRCLEDGRSDRPIVHEAASGVEGIEKAVEVRPDCILLDYRLPDFDGIQVVRTLHGQVSGAAIVMLTAIGNERVAVEAMKAGALDYASKDAASPEALQHIVRNAIEKCRLQDELKRQRAAIEHRNVELEEAIRRASAARNEAEASRREYHLLVETVPQLVWRSDVSGGIQFSNQRWKSYTGASSGGENWLDRVHAEDRESVGARWRQARAARAGFEVETKLLAGDGRSRWHLISAVAPTDQEEVWLFTATDVTEQREAQQALLQKQKLDSIGLLAGGVAHDFNNLLVGIMGSASLALNTVADAHPAHTLLGNVVEASERAAHLTRQLLAYAGKGQFIIEPVNLEQTVRRTTELVNAFIPKTVQLQLDIEQSLPTFLSDPGEAEQVVMNLLINAAEAIGPERHGLIGIRAAAETVATNSLPVDVTGAKIPAGRYVMLEIRDTGPGITEEVRAKMFDPFFTTKFTGRGLGLAAVQGIVRRNQGAIQVDSAPGKGTTFRVLWPAHFSSAPLQQGRQAEATEGVGVILVVDDERLVRAVAEVALRKAGYAVLTAESGPAALEALSAHPEVNAVLLDMNMPEMTGPEFLARITERRRDLPVIVCSGFTEDEVRRQFAGFSLAGVLQKPFTAQKLAARVTMLLSSHVATTGRS